MNRRAKPLPLPRRMRFARNESGIAAVEFALLVPILLLLYVGATDLTHALAIDRKLGTLASTVSDLIAQEREITPTQVQAYFDAADGIIRPFNADLAGVRVAVIRVEGTTTTLTGTLARNWDGPTDTPELPDDIVALADGHYVVLANARYDYQPLFGIAFNTTMNLEQRSFHMVRHDDVTTFGW